MCVGGREVWIRTSEVIFLKVSGEQQKKETPVVALKPHTERPLAYMGGFLLSLLPPITQCKVCAVHWHQS